MKKIFMLAVRGYQKTVPPWKRGYCKYYPTCSAYALEAFERFGAVRGLILAAWRLLRCNPFSKGGYDPVPLRFLNSDGIDAGAKSGASGEQAQNQ